MLSGLDAVYTFYSSNSENQGDFLLKSPRYIWDSDPTFYCLFSMGTDVEKNQCWYLTAALYQLSECLLGLSQSGVGMPALITFTLDIDQYSPLLIILLDPFAKKSSDSITNVAGKAHLVEYGYMADIEPYLLNSSGWIDILCKTCFRQLIMLKELLYHAFTALSSPAVQSRGSKLALLCPSYACKHRP